MSVYRHQQGSYRSYRVARSVDGELRQAYFPRTRDGLKKAKAQDAKWSSEQSRAQRHFTGPARRWSPKPKVLRAKAKTKGKAKTKKNATRIFPGEKPQRRMFQKEGELLPEKNPSTKK